MLFLVITGLVFAVGDIPAQFNLLPNSFRHYKIEDGLSNNWIYCFLEDDLGFIWVGTRDGLNRFDGYEFIKYDESNSEMEDKFITALFQGRHHHIWIGTNYGGLYRYSWEEDKFIQFKHDEDDPASISGNRITSISAVDDDHICIGTNGGGLNLLHTGTLEFERINPESKMNHVTALANDESGGVWIGTMNGLFNYNHRTGVLDEIKYKGSNHPYAYDRILSAHIDIQGRLWVGTSGSGLYFLDREAMRLQRLSLEAPELRTTTIRKITSSPDGKLLLGTANYGVVVVDPVAEQVDKIMHDPDDRRSILNNSVYDIMYDRFGSLWIANDASGGINYYNPHDQKFNTETQIRYKPNGLSNSNIRCFFQDSEGGIWLGTRDGLNLRRSGGKEYTVYPVGDGKGEKYTSLTILSVEEDQKGNLWIGTFSGGVKMLNRKSGEISQFYLKGNEYSTLEHAHVYDIMLDSNGNIWLATMGGAFVVSQEGHMLWKYTINTNGIRNHSFRVLMEDSAGRIWMGARKGLCWTDPGNYQVNEVLFDCDTLKNISDLNVFCLFENENGEIWAGTESGGIKMIDPDNLAVRTFSLGEGLPDNTVNAIEKDQHGYFWLSTSKGICRFNEESGEILHFTSEDGLQANDFFPNASLHSKGGELFFGGPNGMNHFNPANIDINQKHPEVVFTSLYLKNREVLPNSEGSPLQKPMPLTDELVLTHQQSSISVHFAGLGYVNPEKYRYSYFLEGFDNDWSAYGRQRFAIYNNLRPGTYTLFVRMKNNDNQESNSIARLPVTVKPAPWVSWYAYLIYLVILTGLLVLFRYYILAWAKMKSALELEKQEKSQIQELNKMKLGFFTNISHEFRTPLTLLKGYVETLSGVAKDRKSIETIAQINRNSDRLLNLVNELMDFRKAENGLLKLKASKGDIVRYTRDIVREFEGFALHQGVDLSFRTDVDVKYIWFDPGKIEKVLFNLLSNALKFTPAQGVVEVYLSVNSPSNRLISRLRNKEPEFLHDWVEIGVSDTGKGIPGKDLAFIFDRFFQVSESDEDAIKGTGIGLALSRKLVEIHYGELQVKSVLGEGSVFTVRLPVGSVHLKEDEKYIVERERFYLRIDYKSVLNESLAAEVRENEMAGLEHKSTKVLIIDDNMQIVNLLRDFLSERYKVFFAVDGESGLKIIADRHPDIVISDVMMPGISGIEVCRRVKSDLLTSHIPVVLLTAKAGEESKLEGLTTGADAYLSKPFSSTILVATIENILMTRQKLKERFSAMEEIIPSEVSKNKVDEQFLNRVIAYIEDNIADPDMDVVKLCSMMGMSRSALYRKIKYLTNLSIQEFIRKIRLRKARQYLVNTDKSISEVSYLVGFPNAKNFSTSFRKEFNQSPSEFRG